MKKPRYLSPQEVHDFLTRVNIVRTNKIHAQIKEQRRRIKIAELTIRRLVS